MRDVTGNFISIIKDNFLKLIIRNNNFIVVAAVLSLSCVQVFSTPCQSIGFPRQEYWSGLPLPSPGDPPNPGIEPTSPVSPALAGEFFTSEPPQKPFSIY